MTRLEIAEDIENISNVKDQRTLVNHSIQRALERISEFHDWPYYIQDKGVIETIAPYETGTITVTNGSKTITGSGTTFTSAMAGRKIRVAGGNAYYRIAAFVSTTEITLEYNYPGSTASAQTYKIYKDEFRLNADVDKYKLLRQSQNSIILFDTHPTNFDSSFPMPNSYSAPIKSIMVGTKLDVYTTGSVSATGTTITGSSTSWTSAEGLGRMSKIRIGNNVYTVKSVDSDTQITTYETVATVAAGTSYEITLNNLVVQLYNIPDSAKLLYYRYFRLPVILANNYDIPDMPHNWHWLLMYGGLSIILMQKGDINKSQIEAEARFIDGLNMMKLKIGSFSPDRIYKRKSIDRIGGNIDGLEGSAFDRRFSYPSF